MSDRHHHLHHCHHHIIIIIIVIISIISITSISLVHYAAFLADPECIGRVREWEYMICLTPVRIAVMEAEETMMVWEFARVTTNQRNK